jgi:hypothetical protein
MPTSRSSRSRTPPAAAIDRHARRVRRFSPVQCLRRGQAPRSTTTCSVARAARADRTRLYSKPAGLRPVQALADRDRPARPRPCPPPAAAARPSSPPPKPDAYGSFGQHARRRALRPADPGQRASRMTRTTSTRFFVLGRGAGPSAPATDQDRPDVHHRPQGREPWSTCSTSSASARVNLTMITSPSRAGARTGSTTSSSTPKATPTTRTCRRAVKAAARDHCLHFQVLGSYPRGVEFD